MTILGHAIYIFQAIYSAKQRETLQKMVGPDLVFIVLSMSKECQKKRVLARHGENFPEEFMHLLIKAADSYEQLILEKMFLKKLYSYSNK